MKTFFLLWTFLVTVRSLESRAPTKAERLQRQAQRYEKEAERAEVEAAAWAQRAQRAATDAGAVSEKVKSAIRKRGVLDWVKQSGHFKRLMTSQDGAHANVMAELAAAPYVKAEMSYVRSEGEYRHAAAAWQAEEASAMERVARLQAAKPSEAHQAEQHAKDAARMAAKYSTVADRISEALPTIKKMEKMAAARATWVAQPFPVTEPHELVSVTIAPPLADAP